MRRRARIAEDRARAERARPELHAALEPADRLARRPAPATVASISSSSLEHDEARAGARQTAARSRLAKRRPEIGARMRVAAPLVRARRAVELVIGGKRRAERAAGIAGGGLDPDVLETCRRAGSCRWRRNSARRRRQGTDCRRRFPSPARASAAARSPRSPPGSRPRDPCGAGSSSASGLRGGAAEQLVKSLVRHRQAGAIIEIVQVQAERAVRLQVDQMVQDALREFRLAVGREPHHLVLAGVDLEAGVIGEGRVEQAERMRKVDLL